MNDPKQALAFALEKYPARVDTVPVDQIVLETARQNPKRPAYIKLAVPDEVVKALRGSPERRQDLLFLVSMPKEVIERSESSIILPNEIT